MSAVEYMPFRALGENAEIGMPGARSGACSVTVGDEIVMYGGLCGDSELLGDVCVFNTKTNLWRKLETTAAPNSGKPRATFGACSIELSDNKVLVIGGQCFERYPSVAIHHLDVATAMWHEAHVEAQKGSLAAAEGHDDSYPYVFRWGATLLHAPRAWWPQLIGRGAAATATDVILEICGDGLVPHRDVTVLWRCAADPLRWTYRLVNQGPESLLGRRRHAGVLFRDEFILVFGGRCERRFLHDLWLYSISANCWCELTLGTDPELLKELFAAQALNVKTPQARDEAISIQRAVMHAINRQRDPPSHNDTKNWPGQRTGLVGFMSRDSLVIMTGFAVKTIDSYLTYNDVWTYDLRRAQWTNTVPQRDFASHERPSLEASDGKCIGPQPHSMSAFTPLPNAPPGTFFLHGGRLHDHAICEAFVLRVVPPQPMTLYECVRRLWIHSELRSELKISLAVGRERTMLSPRSFMRSNDVPPRAVDAALRKAISTVSDVTPACRLFTDSMSTSAVMEASSASFLASMEAYPEG
jgi:hypothetical protein